MPKSNKSPILTFRAGRWLLAAALLGLLLACGGGGAGDALFNLKVGIEPCDSVPSALQTRSCSGTDGTGTYTFKTETASCSEKSGQVIFIDKGGCTPLVANGNDSDPPPAVCKSVLSDPVTAVCTGGQLGTHTFQTETASCSANNGKIIVDDTSACLANTSANRIKLALKKGDTSVLNADDHSTIISLAADNYQSTITEQNELIEAFYKGLSTKFDLIRDSYMVQSSLPNMENLFPLVMGDKGNTLASISRLGGGRIAGYGYDILAGFVPNQNRIFGWNGTDESPAKQTDHQPVFKRVLAWLASGDPTKNLAGQTAVNLNIAWSSLPSPTSGTPMYTTSGGQKVYKPYAADGLAALNIPFTNLQCDPLSAPVADCAAKAQIVVIGAYDRRLRTDKDTTKTQTQLDRIKAIVEARIPILYLNSHPDGGAPNDYARATWPEDFPRLDAMGFANGDTPDRRNLYVQDSVGSELTVAQLKARNDPLSGGLLARINNGPFKDASAYDWSNCPVDKDCVLPQGFIDDIKNPLDKIKKLLDAINSKGQNLFDPQVGNKTLQQLVLWADAYRKNIVYPINKLNYPEKFQKAYIVDALVAYVRPAGSAQTDLGNFLNSNISQVKGSTATETVNVTLPGSNGFTAIGRFALPGQAFTLQLRNKPATGTFTFFVNTAGEGNTKLFTAPVDDNNNPILDTGYRRPRLPRSPDFPLSTQPITIVSPYGGVLELRFKDSTDTSLELQIQGVAKQPFYDTTQGTPNAAAFLTDVLNSKLDWLEIKTAGVEIHSLIKKTKEFLLPATGQTPTLVSKPYYDSTSNTIDMAKYLAEAKKYVMDDAFQLAGLQLGGLTINQRVRNYCTTNDWQCDSRDFHKARDVQHYHADEQANCGSMCSGNPITASSAFEPRHWGESHELGHNLQEFKIYSGISGEVSNNIFPLHKKWRMRIDLGRDAIGYGNELEDTQVVFNMLKSTYLSNKSNTDKIAKVRTDLWSDGSYAAQNRLRLYFYLQWPLIYADIIKAQNSQMAAADAIEAGWDIFTLLYLNLREIEATAATNWDTRKTALGFSKYSAKPATTPAEVDGAFPHHDYLLVMLSKITGKDQTPIFDLWGIQTTQAGKDQVAAFRGADGNALPKQAVKFYATRCSDDFRDYASVNLTDAFPWQDEFKLSNDDAQASTKKAKHNKYCLDLKQ
jgi:hypothetical protein